MSKYIPVSLRKQVIERANGCCEYCLLSQEDIFFAFEIDHIVAEKHGGQTDFQNLCLSCPDYNRYKGSDVGSYDEITGVLTPLFNPRRNHWAEHFELNEFEIIPLTDIGRVTVRLLKINLIERIEDRRIYAQYGSYPCR